MAQTFYIITYILKGVEMDSFGLGTSPSYRRKKYLCQTGRRFVKNVRPLEFWYIHKVWTTNSKRVIGTRICADFMVFGADLTVMAI